MKLEDRCNNCEYMKTSWGEKPCFGCIFNQQTNHSNNFKKIKDEPMRAEEWAEQNYKNFDCLHDYIDYATRAFKAGASENEKKYRAQYTCKDAWWDKWQSMPDNAFKHGWNECLKSHNLPEEN